MKILNYVIVLLFMVTLWGCSQGNSSAPVTIDPATNRHPDGWALNGTGGTHPVAYFAAPASCEGCHGLPSDPKGGISGVSCSNPGRSGVACHPSFPHAIGFSAYNKHGQAAKDTASGVTGMAHCKQCHGSNYTGAGFAPSCVKCHNDYNPSNHAPHAANWGSGNVNGLSHSSTVTNNAPACAQCHLGGRLSSLPPPTPAAAAGTAPGCYNNTLCHGPMGHALPYVTGHQAAASANISSCQPCHATPATGNNPRFNLSKGTGVLNGNGCENCHNKPGIAHPFMWLPGRGTAGQQSASHANAGTVNVSCGLCHGTLNSVLTGTGGPGYTPAWVSGSGITPSCMISSINGTVCHFTKPVDAQGISIDCVSCHATPPNSANPPTAGSPNRSYGHANHWAIPGIAADGGCNNCHNGSGYGMATHANGTVQTSPLPTKFENIAGTPASYNTGTGTCTNISCHGNFTVPFSSQPWTDTTPVLDLTNPDPLIRNESCYNCHYPSSAVAATIVGVPVPYIGPFSGKVPTAPQNDGNNLHWAHTRKYNILCLDCHTLTVHFNSLMQGRRKLAAGFAAGTVSGTGTSVTVYTAGDGSPGTGSCTPNSSSAVTGYGCHSTRNWY